MKVVIVGGVAAGASTGARVRRLDDSAEIVILERGRYVSFANCGLPYHIGGEIPDRNSLLLQTPESLGASLALDVRTGHEVMSIDPTAKVVEVREIADGRIYREPYDKLVLCPGAGPIRPSIPGADHPRVDVLRNIPDMDRIIGELDSGATRAVVIGGSYIGLEMTEALRIRGLQTTVVERTDRLMPWLDPEMTRILDFHVGTHGVNVRLGSQAQAIREEGTALGGRTLRRVGISNRRCRARSRGAARYRPGEAGWSDYRTAWGYCCRRPDAHLGAGYPRRW